MADQAARDGVFISYATGDGTAFAEGLRAALTAHHIDVWQDVIKLRGGDNWWQQIVEAITSVKYVLMVLTPLALGRPTVQKEWRLARQEGVRVLPILASPEVAIDSLPRWMQKIQLYRLGFDPAHIDQAKNWPLFLNDLQTTYELKRRPFMADDLGVFVPRQREYDALIDLLIHTGRGEPKAITSALALKGAGGYGKTTLARAICHDERIQEAFDDGILWVTIGESATADTVRQQIDSLITVLSGERYDAPSLEAAKTRLRELLADRDMLMVIDDVWNSDHLRPFLQGGERVARLITTRMGDVLPDGAKQVGVNQMTGEEAFALLTHALPAAAVNAERSALARLTADLMEYPLPIKLANGILRERVNDKGQPLNKALAYVNDLLAEFGLALDDRTSIVEAALRASLDQLDAIDLMHFKRLAIFPEDVAIPLRSLSPLWRISAVRVERVCERLFDLSLLLDFDLTAQTIRLHDVIRDLLIRQAGSLLPRHGKLDALSMIPLTNIDLGTDQYLALSGDLPAWHREFLTNSAVQARIVSDQWVDLPDEEPYLWEWLSYHLIEAGWGEALIRTVLDLRYVARKTQVKSPTLVERDLETAAQFARVNGHAQAEALELLTRNYRNMSHILRRCETPKDMLFTLHLRLSSLEALKPSCEAIAPMLKPPSLIPWRELPDLPHPALLRTLTGHTAAVHSTAYNPEGRLIVSGSFDKTIKVWDADTGAERLTFSGHTSMVNSVAWSPDGHWIVSASGDKTFKVWDVLTGMEHMTLGGHTREITSAAWSPDGRWIVSSSGDRTLKVWDAATGAERLILSGHAETVIYAAWSPDSRWIASTSADKTIKVWDLSNGTQRLTLEGHTGEVRSAAWSPDGRQIVSASEDGLLKVWDAVTGTIRRTLEGHTDQVWSAAWSPDGRSIASCSFDKTVKVWDAMTGANTRTFSGHTAPVTCVGWSPDSGSIVSTSWDKTIKVWDSATSAPHTLIPGGHIAAISSVAYSPDGGSIVSASDDYTNKVWDVATGAETLTLSGHTKGSRRAVFSPDGRWIVSGSWDNTVKLWDASNGMEVRTLSGHTAGVNTVLFSPDSRWIISGSWDKTIKVWEAASGAESQTLQGHTNTITSLAYSPDGRWLLSGSFDQTLKLWEVVTGEARLTLNGHTKKVTSAAWSPDGRQWVSASFDQTLKVWAIDVEAMTGAERLTLSGHTGYVNSAAWSPDGRWIVSASSDKTLKVWDAVSGVCRATFYADALLWCCIWSPDGASVIASGAGGYLYWLRWVE